jgi:hypothetical protein
VVTLQIWGSAVALVVASLLVGRAFAILCGGLRLGAPAFGLSALIIVASIAIRLPGAATTASFLLLVLVAGAGVVVFRAKPVRPPLTSFIVAALAALGAAIPFIANGRMGLPGVSLDNDTWYHLIDAQALSSSATRRIYPLPSNGYPLGPHSLAATIASGVGVRLDYAFTGLLIAIVIVTALVASEALWSDSGWKRVLTGVVAALFYLVAAYYAEAAFKEPLLGLLLLAFVLHLEEVVQIWPSDLPRRCRALVPGPVMIAAAVYIYSYLAVGWFALTLAIWLAAELVFRPARLRLVQELGRQILIPGVAAVGLLVVLLSPDVGRVLNFFTDVGVSPAATGAITINNVGNLPRALSPYEALGIWTTPDFRFVPGNVFNAGALGAFALAVLVVGIAWSLARREFLLPAAVLACALIYWRASHGQSFYVSAKALVIAGPVVAVTGMRGLLGPIPEGTGAWLRGSRLAAAAVFIALTLYSSYDTLRNEPVWPAQSTDELLSLAKLTRGQTVLFLGNTDYAEWLFHDSLVSALAPTTTSLGQALERPTKPNVNGEAFDFDTVDPPYLNRFDWVITTNTPYASQPPAAFRLVRQLPMYELYKRVGAAIPRQVLEPPGAPGAVLNCRTSSGRALSRRQGIAAVMPTPAAPPMTVTAVPGGGVIPVQLGSLRGRWELSLQYTSDAPVQVYVGNQHWTMPPYLDRPGPWFSVGRFDSTGGPTIVTIEANRPSAIAGPDLIALISGVAATRVPDTRQIVPLSKACGRYVDWYRLG